MNLRPIGNRSVERARGSPCHLAVGQKKLLVNSLLSGLATYETIASRYPISIGYLRVLKSRMLRGKKLRGAMGKASKLDARSRVVFEGKMRLHPEWGKAEMYEELEKQVKETWLRENEYESEDFVPEELRANMAVSRRTLRRYLKSYLSDQGPQHPSLLL